MKKIFCKKGEGYIETVVSVVASMMVVAAVLNIFSFITIKQDMDFYVSELTEKACFEGSTVTGIDEQMSILSDKTGLNPDVSFAGTKYWDTATGKVQYGENISVKITYRTSVKGLGVFNIPVTLSASSSGLSRRYWK